MSVTVFVPLRCVVTTTIPLLLLEICMPRNRRASVLRPEKFEYKLGCIKITSLGRHHRFRASLRPFHRNPRTYLPGASKTFPSPGILFGCSSLYPSPRVVCLHVPLCSSRRIPLASSHTLSRSLNMHTYIYYPFHSMTRYYNMFRYAFYSYATRSPLFSPNHLLIQHVHHRHTDRRGDADICINHNAFPYTYVSLIPYRIPYPLQQFSTLLSHNISTDDPFVTGHYRLNVQKLAEFRDRDWNAETTALEYFLSRFLFVSFSLLLTFKSSVPCWYAHIVTVSKRLSGIRIRG